MKREALNFITTVVNSDIDKPAKKKGSSSMPEAEQPSSLQSSRSSVTRPCWFRCPLGHGHTLELTLLMQSYSSFDAFSTSPSSTMYSTLAVYLLNNIRFRIGLRKMYNSK